MAKRTAAATPEGESSDIEATYVVSYKEGDNQESTRTDIVANKRRRAA